MGRDFLLFPVPALTAVAERVGRAPLAAAYLSQSRGQILVASMTSPTLGLYVETNPVTNLAWETATDVLGQCVWEALLGFREDTNLGSSKKTDWPAYKASGARSVRSFEEDFVRVKIEAFPCVLRVEAYVPAKAAEDLFVGRHITNACDFSGLGDLIHLVYRSSLHIMEKEYN